MPAYQAPQIDPSSSFDTNRANEAERRGWGQDSYDRKNLEPVNYYDFTRKKLNFEIKRGEPLRDEDGNIKKDKKGRTLYAKPSIIPLGTQPISLKKRYDKRLEEIGYKPWENANGNQPNTNVSIVLSGDHDRMTEIAFGKPIDFEAGKDNSQIQLVTIDMNELETVANKYGVLDLIDTDQTYSQISIYALCYYKFLCDKFGEENVIGLMCHLDETTPHFHSLIIPIAEKQKSGRSGGYTLVDEDKNPKLDENGNEIHITTRAYERMPEEQRTNYVKTKSTTIGLSCATYFGKSISEVSRSYEKWHDMIHEEVTKQWGFDRGEVLRNMTPEERNNHRRKSKKQLERERMEAEKRLKEKEEEEKEKERCLKEKEKKEKELDKRIKDKQEKIDQLSSKQAMLQVENAGLQVAKSTGKAAQAVGQSIAGVFGQSSKDKTIKQLQDTIEHEPDRTAVAVSNARQDERQQVIAEIKKAAGLRIDNDGKETAEDIGKAWRRDFNANNDLQKEIENLNVNHKKELDVKDSVISTRDETIRDLKSKYGTLLGFIYEIWETLKDAVKAIISRVNDGRDYFNNDEVHGIEKGMVNARDDKERQQYAKDICTIAGTMTDVDDELSKDVMAIATRTYDNSEKIAEAEKQGSKWHWH